MYRSQKKIKSLRSEIRGSVFFGNSTKRADFLVLKNIVDGGGRGMLIYL